MSLILGPDGRPLDLEAVKAKVDEPQTAQLGSIVGEFDRHPARGITPARLQQIMSDAERGDLVAQAELADDMQERDAHLYAELGKRRGAITAIPWSIEPPANPSEDEKALTERVRDWVGMLTAHANGVDGGMDVLLGAMTAAVLPGFAPIEMVWRLEADADGRQVRVPHCTLQPQRWFTLDSTRRRFLLRSQTEMAPVQKVGTGSSATELPPVMGVELQPYSWLMHVHPASNGYLARMSLARVLFWPYLFKNYAVRDLAEFLEIYGLPLRIGRYPAGASDDEKRTLLRAVTSIGHNAAATMPQNMAIDFESAAAGTEVPFVAMWDRLDAAESKAILGQTLSASEGQHGTQALGKVHNEVRMDIRNADARLYESSFSRQVIAPLCALNEPGVNMRRLPRLALDTGEAEDLEAFATNLPPLVQAGVKVPVKWVHEKLRIPQPEDGEEVLQAPAPPPAAAEPGDESKPGGKRPLLRAVGGGGAKGGALAGLVEDPQVLAAALMQALASAAALRAAPQSEPDLVDQLVAEEAARWQPLLMPLVQPLIAELDNALAAGETVEAFAARLPQLLPRLDAQAVTESLARAAFSARLAGEAGLDLAQEQGP